MSDLDLIEEIKLGKNRLAIGEIYKRYAHLMFGVSLKYLKNKMEAEDLMMNLFEKLTLKITKSTTGDKQIKNLKNWLYTVTKNECLMLLRKTNKLTPTLETALIYKADDGLEKLEEVKLTEIKITILEQAIVKLKDAQKICIELFYIKGKCYDEIVLETNFDLKKVKSYIQNGKRNLKLILENEQVFKS